MLHRHLLATADQATVSAYYLAGVTVGVLPWGAAKDWAFSVIEALDTPPIEVIEIALANSRVSAIDALGPASAGGEQQTAGRWLLADLEAQLAALSITPMQAARFAMQVVQATALPQDAWYAFDALDDELQLAVNGAFGTPEQIGQEILLALREYSSAT